MKTGLTVAHRAKIARVAICLGPAPMRLGAGSSERRCHGAGVLAFLYGMNVSVMFSPAWTGSSVM